MRVAAVGKPVLGVQLQLVEPLVVYEVDDAGDRVRTVSSRSTAGDDVDALDRERRHDVEVDVLEFIERSRAAAIDEDEVAIGAEAAKVDHVHAVLTAVKVGRGGRQRAGEGRNFVEHVGDVGRAALVDKLGADRLDRGRRLEVALDARAGDRDDLGGFIRLSSVAGGLRKCRSCHSPQRHTSQALEFGPEFHLDFPFDRSRFYRVFQRKGIDIAFLIGNKAALLEIFLKLRLPYSAEGPIVSRPGRRED